VVQRFDKSLEEFYAICDQIELDLVSINLIHTLQL